MGFEGWGLRDEGPTVFATLVYYFQGQNSMLQRDVVRKPDGNVTHISEKSIVYGLGISIRKPDGNVLDLSFRDVLDGRLVHRACFGHAEEFCRLVDVCDVHVIPEFMVGESEFRARGTAFRCLGFRVWGLGLMIGESRFRALFKSS